MIYTAMHIHFYNIIIIIIMSCMLIVYFFVLLYRGTMNDFPSIGKEDFSP